ncbi:MAG: PaaI family thioesterase, partial [Chloroflexota bacterium]
MSKTDKLTEMTDAMRQAIPEGMREKLILPPPVFEALGGKVLDFDLDAQTMRVQFPVEDRFRNPLGFLQGGIIAAMMDNTVGPLSFLVAPPSVTTQFNTTYIRPVTPQDKIVIVEAVVTERTRRNIYMTATALNEAGKTVAIGHAA